MSRSHEVIVVGGGVTGSAVAFDLARRSVDVLLIDRSLPGRATSASAGGLWAIGEGVGIGCGVIAQSARQQANGVSSEPVVGPEPLPKAFRDFLCESNSRFSGLGQVLRELSEIDIEYEESPGLVYPILGEAEHAFATRLLEVLEPERRPELLSCEDLHRIEPNLTQDLLGGLRIRGEYQVNPMLLTEALKRSAVALGATFQHETRVTCLRRDGDRVVGVEVGDDFVACDTVVNAAGAWAGRLAAEANLQLPVFPVRGQIVLTETLPSTLNCSISTDACYLAQKAHGEVLIGSTTEHVGFDTSVTLAAIVSLSRGAVRAVPMLERVGVKRVWAGLRPGTPDELPILGPVDGIRGYLNAAGGFRTGVVTAPLTGEVVAQAYTGEEPTVPLEPFLVNRFGESDAPMGGPGPIGR